MKLKQAGDRFVAGEALQQQGVLIERRVDLDEAFFLRERRRSQGCLLIASPA